MEKNINLKNLTDDFTVSNHESVLTYFQNNFKERYNASFESPFGMVIKSAYYNDNVSVDYQAKLIHKSSVVEQAKVELTGSKSGITEVVKDLTDLLN